MTARLELRAVQIAYGDHVAVQDVDLSVADGEIVALVGPSGCGKTTLLRGIAGFEPLRRGEIELDGRSLAGVAPERREIGMVFQHGALFPHMTVEQNVAYGVTGSDSRARVAQTLDLAGLTELAQRYPDELSGGQQQLTALARALAPRPGLILLDEPFASLDAGLRARVRTRVREMLSAEGATAILVTHDQGEALGFSDRVAVMRCGSILQSGPPREIHERPNCLEVAEFIGDGRLVRCDARAGRVTSSIGEWETDSEDGEGWLLVRPEDLGLADAAAPGTIRAVVQGCRYRGHDALYDLLLDDGARLQLRRPGTAPHLDDGPLTVKLRGGEFRLLRSGAGASWPVRPIRQ